MNEKLIVALDLPSIKDARKLTDALGSDLRFVKIGMELFYKEGEKAVKTFQDQGLNVFLDLKLHDIPNTVEKALISYFDVNPKYITLQTLGGKIMIEAASTVAKEKEIKLLGVPILTSHSQEEFNNELRIEGAIKDTVISLAKMAIEAKAHGVVSSPLEAKDLRASLGPDALIVTPGVRLGDDHSDQRRVLTPKEAFLSGASHIVIGREVTMSNNPKLAFMNILESVQ